MATPLQARDTMALDEGRLANNFVLIQGLRSTLGRAETNTTLVPRQLLRIIRDDAWRAWTNPETDERFGEGFGSGADIRRFIRSAWPDGLGSSVELIERLIVDTDAWQPYLEAIGGRPGGNKNPTGVNQHTEVITDNIRNDQNPDIIPLPARDRSNDMPGGTSRIAQIRRITKEVEKGTIEPVVLERIRSGDLSPNRAMVETGLRLPTITVEVHPERAAKRLAKHFSGDRLALLIEALERLRAAAATTE